ncbi:hypothetical protein YC2023_027615 [Brassica napus]
MKNLYTLFATTKKAKLSSVHELHDFPKRRNLFHKRKVLEGDHVSNIGEKIEKTGTREKDDYKERLGRCCVYVREGEVGREMATKNHTITKGLKWEGVGDGWLTNLNQKSFYQLSFTLWSGAQFLTFFQFPRCLLSHYYFYFLKKAFAPLLSFICQMIVVNKYPTI